MTVSTAVTKKETNNQSASRISVPIQFQIRCNRIYVENLEEETCEKTGLKKR